MHNGGRRQLLRRRERRRLLICAGTQAPHAAPIRALPAASAPANILVGEQECGSRYRLPSRFRSFCGAFLLSGLTGARSLPACLPDFHSNVFSRTGYVSNQLLHHSMFQHKYMQCSAATILQGALLCNTDCRKTAVPYLPRRPPRLRQHRNTRFPGKLA